MYRNNCIIHLILLVIIYLLLSVVISITRYYYYTRRLDPNNIKIHEKSYKNILVCHIGTVKYLGYPTNNNVNPLYLIINQMNGYIEESNWNKCLRLNFYDGSKDTLMRYEELLNKIKYLIRSITNNSDDYDKKYMKIKVNSDNDLPLKKNTRTL